MGRKSEDRTTDKNGNSVVKIRSFVALDKMMKYKTRNDYWYNLETAIETYGTQLEYYRDLEDA